MRYGFSRGNVRDAEFRPSLAPRREHHGGDRGSGEADAGGGGGSGVRNRGQTPRRNHAAPRRLAADSPSKARRAQEGETACPPKPWRRWAAEVRGEIMG